MARYRRLDPKANDQYASDCAYSCFLKDRIELFERERTTMTALFHSRTKLPAWLQRRKTKEQQEMEEEALRVANRWGCREECVEMIDTVLRKGEGLVHEVQRMLGFENKLPEDEDPRFGITWDHRSL